MAEFADRHASERKMMGFSKAFKRLDGLDNFVGRCGRLRVISRRGGDNGKPGGILNQTGCIRINPNSPRRGLTDEFRLKFRREFDRNAHWHSFPLIP